jgi:glutathione peroxidase
MVLGFPCNQFLSQEPETNETVEQVCKMNFGVTFPLLAKIDVNGRDTHPLFQFLKSKTRWFWKRRIQWNFTKFLIDRDGNLIERYAPTTSPKSLHDTIAKLINK